MMKKRVKKIAIIICEFQNDVKEKAINKIIFTNACSL